MVQPITVKAPKMLFDVPVLRAGLEKVLANSADEAEAHFQLSVLHFRNPPNVYKRFTKGTNFNKAVIGIKDAKYARLSEGTTTHMVGVGGKYMRFPGFRMPPNVTVKGGLGANKHLYKPKTSPNRIASKPGFPMVGTQMLIRRGPWPVSGIEPRKFDEQIAAAVGPGFIEKTNKAVELAMKGKK